MHFNDLIHKKSFEKIKHVLRRHPITFIPTICIFLILFAVPSLVGFLLESVNPNIFVENSTKGVTALAASFYYVGVVIFFYAQFVDYYLDLWVITNHRVIDVDQKGLFARTVAELDLYKVQDVTSEIHGFFNSIFNFGDLHVQSAGERSRFHFKSVKDPHGLRKDILELIRLDKNYHLGEKK